MEPDFENLYKDLEPAIQQLETYRIALKQKGTKNGLFTAGILFTVGCLFSLYAQAGPIGIVLSLLLAIGTLIYCIDVKSRELSLCYKNNIISAIVRQLCEEASFTPDQGIPESTFMASGLFSTSPDRYHSEDLITGKIGKTLFSCSEIVAEERKVTTDNKGHRHEHWVTIFKGFFFIADFQKDFAGRTLIYRNSWFKLCAGLQRVKLENPVFEKNFDTYSTDQVEARYILSPGLMEKILDLDRKFPGKIILSFYKSQVIIAIPESANHFEASIWKSQLHQNHIQQEFTTLCKLTGIIKDLNLNLRIWSKI